jgi:hypothetical protein
MTNEELIKDIQCSKQAFWYKAFPVFCAMATVAIPPSKLSTSSRQSYISQVLYTLTLSSDNHTGLLLQ